MVELYITIAISAVFIVIISLFWRNRLKASKLHAENLSKELTDQQMANAILGERLAASNEKQQKIKEQKNELLDMFNRERSEMSEQFTMKFNLLANEIFETKSRTMTSQNKDAITSLLRPFGEQIDKFRERIEQESKQRFALESEVKRLAELNMQMSQEANNLTTALRGNSKSQGDWGEMILETLLENSGLKRDLHFRTQESLRNAEGQILRPDVILSLPDEKEVVIDSKVSLTAYANYCEAENEDQARVAMTAHVASIRNHIIELGNKSYQNLVASPDFVIMFVPNEPAFLLALKEDNTLWHEAYKKGVVLSSPTNLFAILRIVDDLWKRDSQSKNALEIARQGGDLYDKFVLFSESLIDIGKHIKRTEDAYEKSLKQLSEGSGNLVRRAERLRKLGIKTAKRMPDQLITDDDEYIDSEEMAAEPEQTPETIKKIE